MFGIPITQNAALSGYKLTVARIQKIADHLDTFKGLTTNDQTILLKENADLLVSLRGAIFFDSRKRGVNQVLVSMGVGELNINYSRVQKNHNNLEITHPELRSYTRNCELGGLFNLKIGTISPSPLLIDP